MATILAVLQIAYVRLYTSLHLLVLIYQANVHQNTEFMLVFMQIFFLTLITHEPDINHNFSALL